MKKELQDKKDPFLVHYLKSTKYSLEGIWAAFREERSLKFYFFCFALVHLLGLIYQIRFVEWLWIWGVFLLILCVELLNTAIENVVDLVTKEKNPYAKKAKDCGSGATFVTVILGIVVFGFIFFPYLFH